MSHIYSPDSLISKHPSFVNTDEETLAANIEAAVNRGLPFVCEQPATETPIAIVGGGPSTSLLEIKMFHRLQGHHIMALGGAGVHLHNHGLTPDSVVILDARPFNARFLYNLPDTVTLYLASQCDPRVFEEAKRFHNVFVWHAAHPCMAGERAYTASGLMVPKAIPAVALGMSVAVIGGGTTVGMLSIPLACVLGYRHLNLHGFDSSYAEGKAHPYAQPENDGEETMVIEFPLDSGITYETSMWMATQAAKFRSVAHAVIEKYSAEIAVHGTGLLPAFAKAMSEGNPSAKQFARSVDRLETNQDTDKRADAILSRVGAEAKGVEVGVFQGELSKRLLKGNESLKLVMVDSWGDYDNADDFHSMMIPEEQAEAIKHTLNNTAFAGERATIIKMRSVAAAAMFPDASFDFVFLDADHRAEGVKADIIAWLPKVKPGGWIGGHDYGKHEFGVTGIVNQFAVGKNLDIGAESTWFVRC